MCGTVWVVGLRHLICGDRGWVEAWPIMKYLVGLPLDSVIIHGAARGADSIAGTLALALGMEVLEYPAQWEVLGKAAGPIRNRQMLTEGKPDVVVFFHKDITSSKGTKDMVKAATKAGIPVVDGWSAFAT